MSDIKFTVKSPKGYNVNCYSRDWNHIENNHVMMKDNEAAIKDTISNPEVIYASEEYPQKREVYFRKSSLATYGDKLYTKVIVDRPDAYNKEGAVVSAWPQKTISGNIDKGKGPEYVKPKLGQKK